MPDIYMRKAINNSLIPTDIDSHRYVRGLEAGRDVKVKVSKPRNAKFHRKYFALLHLAHDNQDFYDENNFEAFRREVALRAGFYEEHVHVTGKVSYLPKSISFAKMDGLEFDELYSKSIDVIIKHFMVGTDPDELARQAENYVAFA